MDNVKTEPKEKPQKEELTKQELQIIIQILNQPKQMDLQTAQQLILLSNKISRMIDLIK